MTMGNLKLFWNIFKLKLNTKKSTEQIKKLQEKKLKKLLRCAYEKSAYYHRTFEAAGITAENIAVRPLSDFPSIDKAVLLQEFDELVTVSDLRQQDMQKFDEQESLEQRLFQGKYHVVHSSGSTGRPGYFVYDDNAWKQMLAGIIRAALWGMSIPQMLKLLYKKPKVVYIAATDGRYGGAMSICEGIEGVGAKSLLLDVKAPIEEWVDRLKAFQPDILIGYASAIKILGELLEQDQMPLTVKRVISCGEPVSAGLRSYIEKVFESQVFNVYGASESLALGIKTNYKEGMLLFDDLNVIEVENGVMYLTCLYNMTQPLIRYRMSDELNLKADRKQQQYPFTNAESVQGRDEDLMWFEDALGKRKFIHPLVVEGICIEGLIDYQFCQTGKDSFKLLAECVNLEARVPICEELTGYLEQLLKNKHLDNVQFSIQFTDRILADPQTGKKKLIVRGDREAYGTGNNRSDHSEPA